MGNPELVLFKRDGLTRSSVSVKDFKPYFYVDRREFVQTDDKKPEIFQSLMGDEAVKIEVKNPNDVDFQRRMFSKTFEDDVRYKTRYMIDCIDKIDLVKLRIHYTDIETCIETGETISIAIYDNYMDKVIAFVWRKDLTPGTLEKEYVFPDTGYKFKASIHKYKTEASMYEGYAKFVKETDPDIFTGWYFEQFDMPEIIKAMNRVGVNPGKLSPLFKCYMKKDKFRGTETPVCQGRIVWDTMKAYAELQPTKLPDSSLEAISQKVLGEGKYEHAITITEMWQQNIAELIEYNCKDSVLVYRIDKKCHVTDFYDALRRWTVCGWENLYSATQMWDSYLLRKTHGKFVLPSKRNKVIERIPGADVFEPEKGIHEWVCVLDLKSLYPSIIITFNLSPETLVGNDYGGLCNNIDGIKFKREPVGLLPRVLLEMLEERKKYQTEMKKYPFGTNEYDIYFNLQTAVKVHMNALYGAMLYSGFRLATREVGLTTTFCGRSIIGWIKKEVENKGFKVLYGDTDSVFLIAKGKSLAEIVPQYESIVEYLNYELPRFVESIGGDSDNCHIKIEAKKVYRYIFMAGLKDKKVKRGAKKRYAGRAVWEGGKEIDEADIMGFEFRRRNNSQLSRDLQEKILKTIIGYEPRDNLRKYVRDAELEFAKEKPNWEYIGIPQGVENLDSYETEGPHVRGAKYANEYLGENFKQGDTPKLAYVCQVPSGYPNTDVVCYRKKLPEGFKVAKQVMFEKSVVMKLEEIFDTAGINKEEIFYGVKSLFNY